jgi:type I restriction enzyme M protein
VTRIFGDFRDGETRTFKSNGDEKTLVVSKVFDNDDFGFHKITVERPLRLNFQATPDRIARIEDETTLQKLATSAKNNDKARLEEIEAGELRQTAIRELLQKFADHTGGKIYKNRDAFVADLRKLETALEVRLNASERKAVLTALSERDEAADVCLDARDNPEPDPCLRDTESVPLKEDLEMYFKREVLPHVADAWIDHSKTKVGYEIPLNRHFYVYESPRPLEEIEADIKVLETEILALLGGVTA